ncbi:MAG: hypothetical protein LHW43_03220, partial [Candidatus Cloacimonetes bacterium]|nr:hypothetical protein [Candidatus Cloacimonadota bacterium]
MKIIQTIIILVLCSVAGKLSGAVKTMATDNFMVYYHTGMEDEAIHALQVLEYYRPRLEQLTGNTYPRAAIKLEDMGNLVNGFASPTGNLIGLYMYPPTNDELSFGEDWFQIVAPHEYIHQLQLSHESGLPAVLRTLFGNIFYVQTLQPMWMTEGITVYGESQLSDYSGRMNSAYYSALISALAREDKLPSPTKASYYSSDTPLAHYYVFGGSFHRYLAKTYGEDKFAAMYRDNSSRIEAYSNMISPSVALDPAFKNAYGLPLKSLWSNWQAEEKARVKDIERKQITDDGWNKANLKFHQNALYYTQSMQEKTGPNSGFSFNKLMRLDLSKADAKAETIVSQATDFPAGYHILGDKIFYSRNEYKRGFANRENEGYGAISQILLKDGSGCRILYEGRVRAFLPQADGSLLISEDKALYRGSVLFAFDPASQSKTVLYEGDELIHTICLMQKDIYLCAKPYWSNSDIYKLDNAKLIPIVSGPGANILLYAQDGQLCYNETLDDQLKGYVLDLKSGKTYAVQSEDYLRDPVFPDAATMYYLSPNAGGMDIYQAPLSLSESRRLITRKATPPFARAKFHGQNTLFDGSPVYHGDYSQNIFHMINPRALRLPIIEGSADSLAIGAILVGMDAVGDIPQWQIQAVYDTQRKKVIGDLAVGSRILSPLAQDLIISSDDNISVTLNNSISLFQRQNYGLNSINAGLGLKARNRFDSYLAYPFISQSLSWSGGAAGIRNTFIAEFSDLSLDSRYRTGWQGQLALRQKLIAKSELNSTLNLAYDPDAAPDDAFYPLRGYDHELAANKGATLRNSLYFPMLKIREGLWTPQLYLEDINLGLFYDMAIPQEDN